ncbi:MAG: ATP cone domain-containing protein [Thermoplasmatota archaeon]
MIEVTKEGKRFPFSKGILARSLSITNLPLDEVYSIVKDIYRELERYQIDSIPSKQIKERVREKLLEKGYEEEERFYRISRDLRYLEKPILILIGGGPGVGKSTLSAELGHRLNTNRIIGTDTIREIMRTMISTNLIPSLHVSTFMTNSVVSEPFIDNALIHGFDEQVRLVSEGVNAVIKRGIKEGLNTIINGVHIVPGYLNTCKSSKDSFVFQYILEVPDMDEHIDRFKLRAEGSHRDPQRYIDRINNIREIQEYIKSQARKGGVMIIKNADIDTSIRLIVRDIIETLDGSV